MKSLSLVLWKIWYKEVLSQLGNTVTAMLDWFSTIPYGKTDPSTETS